MGPSAACYHHRVAWSTLLTFQFKIYTGDCRRLIGQKLRKEDCQYLSIFDAGLHHTLFLFTEPETRAIRGRRLKANGNTESKMWRQVIKLMAFHLISVLLDVSLCAEHTRSVSYRICGIQFGIQFVEQTL